MSKSEQEDGQKTISLKMVFKGTLIAFILSLILSIIIGLLLYLTSIPETTVPWLSIFTLIISVFIGSAWTAGKVGRKGLIHGVLVALLFFVLSIILSVLTVPDSIVFIGLAKKLLLMLGSGILGGMVGVGLNP